MRKYNENLHLAMPIKNAISKFRNMCQRKHNFPQTRFTFSDICRSEFIEAETGKLREWLVAWNSQFSTKYGF